MIQGVTVVVIRGWISIANWYLLWSEDFVLGQEWGLVYPGLVQ